MGIRLTITEVVEFSMDSAETTHDAIPMNGSATKVSMPMLVIAQPCTKGCGCDGGTVGVWGWCGGNASTETTGVESGDFGG